MDKARRVFTDALGVALIILALLLGWLPGPGGIPLLLGGLGLLAINHDWAKNLLTYLKKHGSKLAVILLDNPWVQLALDIIGSVSVVVSIWLILNASSQITVVASSGYLVIGLVLLSVNRKRIHKLKHKIKPKA